MKGIILAAGKGTRMNSDIPKVLHLVDGQPMILKVLHTAYEIDANPIITIVGYKADLVKESLKNESTLFALQKEHLKKTIGVRLSILDNR